MPVREPRLPYTKLDADEKQIILDFVEEKQKKGWPLDRIVKKLSLETGRPTSTIYRFLKSYRDTRSLAARYLKAQALPLAKRVVEEADVKEAIDVLTRPNIGVLEPINKGKPTVQILTSVKPETLGAVRAAQPPPELAMLDGRSHPSLPTKTNCE